MRNAAFLDVIKQFADITINISETPGCDVFPCVHTAQLDQAEVGEGSVPRWVNALGGAL